MRPVGVIKTGGAWRGEGAVWGWKSVNEDLQLRTQLPQNDEKGFDGMCWGRGTYLSKVLKPLELWQDKRMAVGRRES